MQWSKCSTLSLELEAMKLLEVTGLGARRQEMKSMFDRFGTERRSRGKAMGSWSGINMLAMENRLVIVKE